MGRSDFSPIGCGCAWLAVAPFVIIIVLISNWLDNYPEVKSIIGIIIRSVIIFAGLIFTIGIILIIIEEIKKLFKK